MDPASYGVVCLSIGDLNYKKRARIEDINQASINGVVLNKLVLFRMLCISRAEHFCAYVLSLDLKWTKQNLNHASFSL